MTDTAPPAGGTSRSRLAPVVAVDAMAARAEFDAELEAVRALVHRAELRVDEVPSPQRLAPYSVALSAEVDSEGIEIASGRLVILHDPQGDPAWPGRYRLVTFARADLEPDLAEDVMLSDVAWCWLTERLEGLAYDALGGTVTRTSGTGFGRLATEPVSGHVEVRASWSPGEPPRLADHVAAWLSLLCVAGGLPPISAPEGIVPMGRRRD